MDNPEIQSSQFASTMEDPDFHESFSSDYSEDEVDWLAYSEDEDEDEVEDKVKDEVDWIAKARRRGRKTAAKEFRKEYFYGRCKDEKTCISPNGRESWLGESSGITWVGVHGNDSICVVTKAVDLDLTRVHGFLIFSSKEKVLRNFRRTVISEMEDLADSEVSEDYEDPVYLADSDSKLREMFRKSIQKPFGVVSVVPLNEKVHKASSGEYQEHKVVKFFLESLEREENGEQSSSDDESNIDLADEDARIKYLQKLTRRHHRTLPDNPNYDEKKTDSLKKKKKKKTIRYLKKEMEKDASITINEAVQESSDEYDEKKAIEFLREKVESGEDFTLERTIQTAISAFELLFKKKFKANEIEVCVMDPDYFVDAEDADDKDIYVNHLETSEIEHLLAVMNKPGSEGSSSEGSCSGGSSSGGSPMSSDGGGSSSGGSPMSSDGSD